ncbi:MAG: bifunctional diaminohydroxyphosphoribosylaminopyrimidine deaminase/5-amino-6-(5-phosphoribosylamino)uracil reductase RibD [Reichenbachiella sp.]
MKRALELAQNGIGNVSPNPLVGCVIVHKDKIIGEGWHEKYGEGHAEVNAVNSVEDKSLLKESTVFVTLEPCAHHGKTPPCADLLINHQVKKVVICNRDPFEQVDGKGIEKLITAGVEVEVGVFEKEGLELNKRFFTFHEKKRPYIILKWAQTADGFVARENFDSKWISGEQSRKLVHKWRAEEDAIMVGTSTARYDNPSLTVRDWKGKNPLRVFIDKNLKLDKSLNLFDQSTPAVCYNLHKSEKLKNLEYVQLSKENLLEEILDDLYKRKVQSLFIEGGAKLLQSFIDQGLWDEARVFTTDVKFEKGIEAPKIEGEQGKLVQVSKDLLEIVRRQ